MKKTLMILGAIAAIVGGSATVASAVIDTPVPAVKATKRGWCVASGTGELRNLWLNPVTGNCPTPFWGPTILGEGTGVAGPKGEKGDKGDAGKDGAAGITITSGRVTVSKDGAYEVRVKGLPKITAQQLVRSIEAIDVDVLRRKADGSAVINADIKGAPVQDGADWVYTVDVKGIDGASETVKVDVIAINPVS